ncbi:MAG TPA: hypothetical protein PLS51_05515 [Flavobacterium sp.]|nr:hypothetical protein [Flavobacterium sp.]HPJ10068.1 hypothetical protein [Flavobacterium sp.]
MNKVVYLFGLLFLALTSCSSDDDTPIVGNMNPDTLLLQKTIVKNYSVNGGAPVTTLWSYSGMKITSTFDSNGVQRTFTYTDNLITGMVETNGSLTKTTVLLYDDEQRLISAASNFETQSFFYNTDGSITAELTDAVGDIKWTAQLTLEGNEIVSIQKDYADGFQTTHQYTYDSKFAPTKNITGFDKLLMLQLYPDGSHKNVIARAYTDSDGSTGQVSRTISYNAVGFPIATHSVDDQFLDSFDAQYFYQ